MKILFAILDISLSCTAQNNKSGGNMTSGGNIHNGTGGGRGTSIVSTRTQSDLSTAMATAPLPAQRAALTPTSTGTYSDSHGFNYPYSIFAPTTTPGILYPIFALDEIEPSSAPQSCGASSPNMAPALALPVSQASYPTYVVALNLLSANAGPLCPSADPNWKIYSAQALKAIIDTVIAANPTHIDPNRIYLGGFSAAGGISWQLVESNPSYAAAIVTASSPMVTLSDVPAVVAGGTAVYMTQGNNQNPPVTVAPQETVTASAQSPAKMYDSSQANAGSWNYVYNINLGHQLSWYADSVTWPDFTTVRNWLFAQHR